MSLDPSSSAIHLNLPAASASHSRGPSKITVHPSVLASILTHHQRKHDPSVPRVIGTLLGIRSDTGSDVEVRSSFAVPHTEDEDKVALDMPYHQSMVDLLNKNGSKEVIVGWYATSPTLNPYSALLQSYFTNETQPYPAVHLTVDPELTSEGQGLSVKGYVSSPVGLNHKAENCVFLPVPVELKFAESERAALDLLATSPSTAPSTPPLPAFASSLNQLSTLIDQALAYVQSVNAGQTQPDPEVGRFLLEGIGRWSSTGSEDEGGVRQGVQDTLTVAYLSNLVRSQVELSGRLGLLQAQPQAQQPTTA